MVEVVNANRFLDLSKDFRIVDVRAPLEYAQGHIPGALNIPLFDDEERKVVGTAYKQINREAAIFAGLDFAGKKLVALAKEGLKAAGRKKVLLVHCWRGGMRSHSMAWLFETMGLSCYLLEGGYKAYRQHIRASFERDWPLQVVGGRTGSGKTPVLAALAGFGEQVIDLEGLAHHKGSAFGALGERPQPSTEQFENDLALALADCDPARDIWVEDESRNIGRCTLPAPFYEQMRLAMVYFLDIPREERARHLVADYALHDPEDLKACVLRIQKKLGGDRTKKALEAIGRADFFETAMISLCYYDKAYMFSLEKNHSRVETIAVEEIDDKRNASLILKQRMKDERQKPD